MTVFEIKLTIPQCRFYNMKKFGTLVMPQNLQRVDLYKTKIIPKKTKRT